MFFATWLTGSHQFQKLHRSRATFLNKTLWYDVGKYLEKKLHKILKFFNFFWSFFWQHLYSVHEINAFFSLGDNLNMKSAFSNIPHKFFEKYRPSPFTWWSYFLFTTNIKHSTSVWSLGKNLAKMAKNGKTSKKVEKIGKKLVFHEKSRKFKLR